MKRLIAAAIIAAAITLAGCAGKDISASITDAKALADSTLASPDAQKYYAMVCVSYTVAKATFNGLVQGGVVKIDAAGMKAYGEAAAVADPLCAPPPPTDLNSAIARIVSAVTSIGRLSIPSPAEAQTATSPAPAPSSSP